jgi:hypothetical protein
VVEYLLHTKDVDLYNGFYQRLELFETIRDYFYPINKKVYEIVAGIINSFYPKEETIQQNITNNDNLLVIFI